MIDLIGKLIEFLQSPVFQQLGIFGLFIYSALPSFISPIPNEIISAPLMAGGMNPLVIILVMSVGGLLGDLLMFFGGKHGRKLFNKKIENAKPSHFMHRHKYWLFVVAVPIPYLSESIMLVAGHQHLNLRKILPFIYIGELLRSIIGTLIVIGILTIPKII